MPVDKQVNIRYEVLNKCFRDLYNEYTIDDLVEECNEALERHFDKTKTVSKRTVQDDIARLQESPYSIRLDEKFKRGRQRLYRYIDTSYSLPQIRMNDKERNKILDAINVLKLFAGEPMYDWARVLLKQVESEALDYASSSFVSFQNNPDLKGIQLFGDLLHCITTQRTLKITYTPFGKSTFTANVYPYHLKQYNDRWFLIAQAIGYDRFGHYALDRIDSFEEVAIPYKESDVDFNEYFKDVIGVTVPDNCEPENVILRVNNSRYHYIDTKPLHSSQDIIEEGDEATIISITVKINKELISLLLSYGEDLEVLAPASLRDEIAAKINSSASHYK